MFAWMPTCRSREGCTKPAGVAGAAAEASRLKRADSQVNNLCLRLSRWLRRFRDCGHLADQSAAQRAA